jgi:hypothetical protein
MAAQKSEKPAAAETANGLQNADRLGGSIGFQNSKSRTRGQIRKPTERPAARRQRRRYPFANIDCRFDKQAFYAVKLFFSRRDYLVWGHLFECAGRHPATGAPSAKIWPRRGMGATMKLSAKIIRRWRRSKERQIRKQFNAYRLPRAQHCARGGK